MLKALQYFTFVAVFAFSNSVWAQAHGIFMVVKGEIKIKSGDGKSEIAKIGKKVFPGDQISSGKDSRAKIVMSDKNVINISPETVLVIEVYQNDGKNKNVQLSILEGKVRAGVEQKYDGEKNRFNIKTPSAVAGVRGTDFLTSYSSATKVSQVITFSGTVAVGTPGPNGRIENPVFVKPGQMTSTSADGKPATPSAVPKEQLNEAKQESNAETAKSEPQKNEKVEAKEEKKEDKKDEPKEIKEESPENKSEVSENSESSKNASKESSEGSGANADSKSSTSESTQAQKDAKPEPQTKTDAQSEAKPEPKTQAETISEVKSEPKMQTEVKPEPKTSNANASGSNSAPKSEGSPGAPLSGSTSSSTASSSPAGTPSNNSASAPIKPDAPRSPAAAPTTSATPSVTPPPSMISVKDLGPSLSNTINLAPSALPKAPVVNIPVPAVAAPNPANNQIVNEIIRNTKSQLNITIIKQP
jgi:hypothetical protein